MTIFFLTFFLTLGMGAGSADGSVKDLFWPFLNVAILFSSLIVILGKKGNIWFKAHAASVREIYDYARQKDSQAQNNLTDLQKKFDDLPVEVERITNEAKKQRGVWKSEQERQTRIRLEQMRKDMQDRVRSEEKIRVNQINNFLAKEIVKKVKNEIKKNSKWSKQIHRNLMEKLDI
ncbi:MAG: hypothetical protein OXB84_05655 [Halobacteriovoraceae bacterium]|nr:hypothetical protein [Halobacteriovoraceae bacterium]